jgi:phosphoglycerol transferase MdoB-like AlkP superfamily enzyme
MGLKSDALTVTTALMVAFALFVIYTRFKNWLDSNVPIFFYVILIAFVKSVDGTVPLWLMLAAFALGLVLRFEFMNVTFARVVKVFELCALAAIIYFCVQMILG